MSNVIIKSVSSRKEKKQFLNLPWDLHRDDPHWIPPLRTNQKELVGYKPHPFYDDAEGQTFLAFRDGRPCGRILALVNHAHNRQHKEQIGFFGFFESIDDAEVAAGLFDAARDWLAEREMQVMRGPVNPSLNYECGLLVEGFGSPATFMMTYNPEFYGRLIEEYGFEKSQDLYAFWGHIEMLETLDKKLEFVVEEAKRRFEITVRPLKKKHFTQEINTFLNIYNLSLTGTWGYVPMSQGEIQHMADGLKNLIVPELTVMGEVDGRAIGCTFGLLDYNPRIKQIDGRLFPFGFIRLLARRRRIKRIRIISTNVLPEYQRWGVGLVLVNGLLPKVLEWGIEEGEFSWVLESNHLSRKTLEKGGAKRTKTYRIYDYDLSR